MLFAIVTQPLLDFFDHLLRIGLMHVISVNTDLVVCHQLFADDVGMFIPAIEGAFHEARDAIVVYEAASGACLNLKKSVVIPFRVCNLRLWLVNSGCIISPPGTVQKYLGALGEQDWTRHNFLTSIWSASALGCRSGLQGLSHLLDGCCSFNMSYKLFRSTR